MVLPFLYLLPSCRFEEANKSFSAAVQVQDGQVKAWALWGDYLDQLFAKDRNLTLGVAALTCFLHACRQQHEAKSHKYLARTIWMLTYDDDEVRLRNHGYVTVDTAPRDVVKTTKNKVCV